MTFLLLAALATAGDGEPDHASAYREFLLARLASADGDLRQAASHLDLAQDLDPGAAEIRASRAMLALRLGRLTEAIERGTKATEVDADNALAWEVLSRAWAHHDRLRGEGIEKSVAAQREVVRLRPGDPEARLILARRLLSGGELDAAAAEIDRAEARGGRALTLEMQLLDAYLRAERQEDGLARLEDLLSMVGRAPAPALALHRSLRDRGFDEAAHRLLVALAQQAPPDAGLERELVRTLLAAGAADDAAVLAVRARERWDNPELALLSGRALGSAGRLDEAEAAYRRATEGKPGEPGAWRALARLRARRGEPFEAAETLLRGADEVQPTAPRTAVAFRVGAAEYLLEAEKPEAALELLGEVPPFGGILLQRERVRAVALARTQGLDAAREPLSRLASADGLPPALLIVAEAEARLASLGEQRTAEWLGAEVQRAASDEAALSAARFWTANGSAERATALLREAQAARPGSVELLVELGTTLDALGRDGEAESALREALETAPDHAKALNNLAYLLSLGDGPFEEAVGLAARAVESEPDNVAYLDTLGWALHRAGRTEEARTSLLRAAGRGGGADPVIREHLGDVQRALGVPHLAAENYRRALGLGAEHPERIRTKLEAVAADVDAGS
jgi:Flp pilus assembly protein TadD